MITVEELKEKSLARLNAVLRKVLLGEDAFPVVIGYERLKANAQPSEILRLKELLRSQSKEVVGFGLTVFMEERETRRYGRGTLPGNLQFDSLDDLARYVGKKAWVDRVRENFAALCAVIPEAREWAASHADRLGEGDGQRWRNIGSVVAYFRAHPFPQIYPRQVPVAVHTKFIEENRAEIVSLMSVVSPASVSTIEAEWRKKIGLLDAPTFIEGRFLDPLLAPHLPQHFQAPLADWHRCDLGSPRNIFITENRTTFLTLPNAPSTLAFQGMGYAATRLAEIPAVRGAKVFYWGDMDVQGFAILSRLRASLPHVESVLMDVETFKTQERFKGTPELQHSPELIRAHLLSYEQPVFEECLQSQVRCEQERITQTVIEQVFREILTSA